MSSVPCEQVMQTWNLVTEVLVMHRCSCSSLVPPHPLNVKSAQDYSSHACFPLFFHFLSSFILILILAQLLSQKFLSLDLMLSAKWLKLGAASKSK